MLHVFSTNRVKHVACTPKMTNNKGRREWLDGCRGFMDFLFAGSTSVESDQKVEAKSAPERGDERVEKLRPGRTAADADACACGA